MAGGAEVRRGDRKLRNSGRYITRRTSVDNNIPNGRLRIPRTAYELRSSYTIL